MLLLARKSSCLSTTLSNIFVSELSFGHDKYGNLLLYRRREVTARLAAAAAAASHFLLLQTFIFRNSALLQVIFRCCKPSISAKRKGQKPIIEAQRHRDMWLLSCYAYNSMVLGF